MFHYLVAPNSLANRFRRWRGVHYRRTVLMRSEQQWHPMQRVIFQGANGRRQFGRVLAVADAANGPVRGTVVDRDPGPSYEGYRRANLRHAGGGEQAQLAYR